MNFQLPSADSSISGIRDASQRSSVPPSTNARQYPNQKFRACTFGDRIFLPPAAAWDTPDGLTNFSAVELHPRESLGTAVNVSTKLNQGTGIVRPEITVPSEPFWPDLPHIPGRMELESGGATRDINHIPHMGVLIIDGAREISDQPVFDHHGWPWREYTSDMVTHVPGPNVSTAIATFDYATDLSGVNPIAVGQDPSGSHVDYWMDRMTHS